jgi:hypothetical protein
MASLWITTREAADMIGLREDYFRRLYCCPVHPLVTVRDNGKTGHSRRIWVYRPDIERINERHTRRTA